MLRLSRQQIERMRQQRKHRLKRTLCSRRASRQIHDQSISGDSTDGAAKCGIWSLLQTVGPHPFCQPIHDPLAHQPGGVRGNVTCSEASASSRNDQLRISRIMPQRRNDRVDVVRQYSQQDAIDSGGLQQPCDGRAGDIRLFPLGAAVADRDHDRTSLGRKSLIHPPSLRRGHPATQHLSHVKDEKIERTMQTRFIAWSILSNHHYRATFDSLSRLNT
jgi:hypothetical protein